MMTSEPLQYTPFVVPLPPLISSKQNIIFSIQIIVLLLPTDGFFNMVLLLEDILFLGISPQSTEQKHLPLNSNPNHHVRMYWLRERSVQVRMRTLKYSQRKSKLKGNAFVCGSITLDVNCSPILA